MIKLTPRRDGFTLAEVLVTVAIIAILAAALLPIVSGQLRKADVTRAAADLGSVRVGMEAFLADVRRVPDSIAQLITPLSATSQDVNAAIYPAGLIARWDGPYVDKTLNGAKNIPTGFGGVIKSDIDTMTDNGVLWAILQVDSLTVGEFNDVDMAIDNAVNSTTGRLRYNGTLVKYLALPIH